MSAGSGIVHAEYREKEFARSGGVLEGVQLWVNLPRKFKMEAPHYQDLPAEKFAVATFPGGEARVVAGELLGVRGPARPHVAEEGKSSIEGVQATRAYPVTSPQAGPLLRGPARTYTPILAAHVKLEKGTTVELPVPARFPASFSALPSNRPPSTLTFSSHQLVEYRGNGGS